MEALSIPRRGTSERNEHKETRMTEPGAQYDHIGSKYDEYAQTATMKQAESYTVLRMVGPLAGQRVLDLACGFGFYTRLLKQHGAAQVIGIDISPEMVRLGREQEQAEPLGVTYQVYDATALPVLGAFDLVTAIYLLNYATSKDELLCGLLPRLLPRRTTQGRCVLPVIADGCAG
jgi:ubiquinone/menaquinone biosynthesis C-methylase UbiE